MGMCDNENWNENGMKNILAFSLEPKSKKANDFVYLFLLK